MGLRTLLRSHALASIVTRVALGGFPILFVLALRWTWGKETFDLAAAAINWSMYLNVFLLSGFAMVPPAVARLARGEDAGGSRASDLHAVGDHVVLSRWLVGVGVVVAVVLALTVDRTFQELARMHKAELRWWFLMFAAVALAQIPMTLWLGVAQGLGQYGRVLALTALPRVAALVLLPVGFALGISAGPIVAVALLVVLCGQFLIGASARRDLNLLDARILRSKGVVRRVLRSNLNAGLVVLVGTAVTIVPVTLVGRWIPDQVGLALVIIGMANAVAGVLVAAFFPMSLLLEEKLRRPGGVTSYCLRVAGGVAVLTFVGVFVFMVGGLICNGLGGPCPTIAIYTASAVLAGVGLRLGALGTQHIAVYKRRPQLNLMSAGAEAAVALFILVSLLPSAGLIAVGVALLFGGISRLALSLSIERRWLQDTASW